MQKILIITPDDNTRSVDYVNWESIQKAVDGRFEICGHQEMELITGVVDVSLYCNEEFLLINDEKYDKINAVASMLCGQEIRGDVALLVDEDTLEGIESRGFDYMEEDIGDGEIEESICEHWCAEDLVLRFINAHEKEISDLHNRFDNNKAEPKIEFYRD